MFISHRAQSVFKLIYFLDYFRAKSREWRAGVFEILQYSKRLIVQAFYVCSNAPRLFVNKTLA